MTPTGHTCHEKEPSLSSLGASRWPVLQPLTTSNCYYQELGCTKLVCFVVRSEMACCDFHNCFFFFFFLYFFQIWREHDSTHQWVGCSSPVDWEPPQVVLLLLLWLLLLWLWLWWWLWWPLIASSQTSSESHDAPDVHLKATMVLKRQRWSS